MLAAAGLTGPRIGGLDDGCLVARYALHDRQTPGAAVCFDDLDARGIARECESVPSTGWNGQAGPTARASTQRNRVGGVVVENQPGTGRLADRSRGVTGTTSNGCRNDGRRQHELQHGHRTQILHQRFQGSGADVIMSVPRSCASYVLAGSDGPGDE